MIVNHYIIFYKKFIISLFTTILLGRGDRMDAAQKDKYVKLGLNIAYYRRLRKYTQLELCERLDIDRSYISKIELGNAGVSLDVLFRLSDVLEVPTYKFFEFRE